MLGTRAKTQGVTGSQLSTTVDTKKLPPSTERKELGTLKAIWTIYGSPSFLFHLLGSLRKIWQTVQYSLNTREYFNWGLWSQDSEVLLSLIWNFSHHTGDQSHAQALFQMFPTGKGYILFVGSSFHILVSSPSVVVFHTDSSLVHIISFDPNRGLKSTCPFLLALFDPGLHGENMSKLVCWK